MDNLSLASRALFHHASGSSDDDSTPANHTCPVQNINDPPQVPFVHTLSFQHFIEILSGACLGFSILVSFFLILRHATHYSMPQEQKQIIRIIFTIPVFSFVSFLCICFQHASIYIAPIEDLYEAFAFAAFFILLYTYVLEESQIRTATGQKLQPPSIRKTAIQVFQFPAVMLVVFLMQEISEATGTYCDTEMKVYFTKLWCTILRIGSTGIAIMGLLRFYKATKPLTAARKPIPKLVAFKGIVFLNFFQTTIFSFLTPHLSPTTKLTTLDMTVGIPHMLISLEMVIFAVVFLKFYGVREYTSGSATYQGGPLGIKAIFAAANVVGFVGEMVREVLGKNERGAKYETVGLTAQEGHYFQNV